VQHAQNADLVGLKVFHIPNSLSWKRFLDFVALLRCVIHHLSTTYPQVIHNQTRFEIFFKFRLSTEKTSNY